MSALATQSLVDEFESQLTAFQGQLASLTTQESDLLSSTNDLVGAYGIELTSIRNTAAEEINNLGTNALSALQALVTKYTNQLNNHILTPYWSAHGIMSIADGYSYLQEYTFQQNNGWGVYPIAPYAGSNPIGGGEPITVANGGTYIDMNGAYAPLGWRTFANQKLSMVYMLPSSGGLLPVTISIPGSDYGPNGTFGPMEGGTRGAAPNASGAPYRNTVGVCYNGNSTYYESSFLEPNHFVIGVGTTGTYAVNNGVPKPLLLGYYTVYVSLRVAPPGSQPDYVEETLYRKSYAIPANPPPATGFVPLQYTPF